MVAGLQSNDRVLCIAGFAPTPEAVLYGLDPRYAGIDCPNGGKAFPLAYRGSSDKGRIGSISLSTGMDRSFSVPDVPLVRFTFAELLEVFLPSFVLAAGLLAIGAVVYRANSALEINLIFGFFTTMTAVCDDDGLLFHHDLVAAGVCQGDNAAFDGSLAALVGRIHFSLDGAPFT